jgi:imidazolonepropionase-like amidohydrolase
MRHVKALTLFLLAVLACSSPMVAQQDASEGGAMLFEGARLIIGDGTPPVENSAFIVENGKFTRVGRKGQVGLPKGGVRVDLTGKTVIPAIIDAHSHLGYYNEKTHNEQWTNYTRENLIEHLRRMAYYGVGVTYSMGNDGGHGELPYDLQAHPVPGATWFRTAGAGISTPGGGQGGARENSWTHVTTTEEARKAVQELVARNPAIVKIWVDDRADRLPPGKTIAPMPPEISSAIIDEAHKHHLQVAAHITYLKDAKELLREGIDGFGHGVRDVDIDDEYIQLLKQHPNTFFTTVLPNRDGLAGFKEEDIPWIAETLPPSQVKRLHELLAHQNPQGHLFPYAALTDAEMWGVQSRNLRRINQLGLMRIAMGTDAGGGGMMGWSAHAEIADMVASGMTPSQAIVAATKTAAEIIKLDDVVGTIAAKKNADFLILDANPLDDIVNTRRISKVYLRGEEVDREAIHRDLTKE